MGLALVATLNPLFVALGVPRGPPRGERVAVGRSAGAGRGPARRGRALAGPLLDVLDVQPGAPPRRRHRRCRRRARSDVASPAVAGARAGRPQCGARPRRRPAVRRAGAVLLGLGAGADLGVLFLAAAFLAIAVARRGNRCPPA